MARAIEFDELGRLILTDGIAFGPPFAQVHTAGLQMGDVLVWYSSDPDWKTTAIQEFSQGPFSHVGIYVGEGSSVDSGPDGVACVSISKLIADFDYGWVFRRPDLTTQQRSDIAASALLNLGRAYAWVDAIALPARRRAFYADMTRRRQWNWMAILGRVLIAWRKSLPPSSKKTFCSRMVIDAYVSIGHLPQEHSIACTHTPFDLASETFFSPIGWLGKSGSPDWHPFDPYSPRQVTQRKWAFSPMKIWFTRMRDKGAASLNI